MKYQSSPDFTHNQDDKVGVLVTNLGTPDAPKKAELKRYLKEFLSDPRVVEVPRLLWWMILNLVILNIRPKRLMKLARTSLANPKTNKRCKRHDRPHVQTQVVF